MRKENQQIIPFKAACYVRSFSHRLNEDAFSLLTSGKTNIFVDQIKEKSFLLECVNSTEICRTASDFAIIAHFCMSNFIMALNTATLGHFCWNLPAFAFLIYRFADKKATGRKVNLSLHSMKQKEIDIRDITETEIRNAVLLFGALCKEKDSNARKEYIKGILHLSFDFFDIDFYREAFGNFYRSFENFATTRIIKARKLKNELKELKQVIIDLGFEDIAEEFDHLYQLRCDQIMHAQKEQTEINIEEVLKMKTILDAILHKVYQPVWEEGLEKLREGQDKT